MATYKAKYQIPYRRFSGGLTTVIIYEKDYSGDTVTELEADVQPVIIDTSGNVDNIYEAMKGTGATIKLRVPALQFITGATSFFTTDAQKFKVKVFSGSTGGTLIFQGFVSSGIYHEDYSTIKPTPITLNCNDGMTLLEDIPYMLDVTANTKYSGTTTIIQALNNILSKLNLDFNTIITNNNLQIVSGITNIFKYLNVCNLNYYDENNQAMNCKTVLKSIFQPLGLVCSFRANRIYFIDPLNLHDATLGKTYNMNGEAEAQFSIGGYQDLSGNTISYFQTGQNIDVVKPFNAVDVTYNPYTFISSSYDMNDVNNHTSGTFTNMGVYFWANDIVFKNIVFQSGATLGEAVSRVEIPNIYTGSTGYHGENSVDYYLKLVHNSDVDEHQHTNYVDNMGGLQTGNTIDASGSYKYVFPNSYLKEDEFNKKLYLKLDVGLCINTRDFNDTMVADANSFAHITELHLNGIEIKCGDYYYTSQTRKWGVFKNYSELKAVKLYGAGLNSPPVINNADYSYDIQDMDIIATMIIVLNHVDYGLFLNSNIEIRFLHDALITHQEVFPQVTKVNGYNHYTSRLIRNILIKSVALSVLDSNFVSVDNEDILTASNEITDIRKRSPLDIKLTNGCGKFGSSKASFSSDLSGTTSGAPGGSNITGLLRIGDTQLYNTSVLLSQSLLSQYSCPKLKLNMNLIVKNVGMALDKYLLKDSKHLPNKAFYVANSKYDDRDESLSVEIIELAVARQAITKKA
jgi:hypothetical protein